VRVKLGSELQAGDTIQKASGSYASLDKVSPANDEQHILVQWSEPHSAYVARDKEYNVYSQEDLQALKPGASASALPDSPNRPVSYGELIKSSRGRRRTR
jgi:hypothetical protein